VQKLIGVALALILWQIAAVALNSFLLVSPLRVLLRLGQLCQEASFYKTIGFSLLRIAAGFVLGFATGALLAVLVCRHAWLQPLLWPYVTVIKTTPVASFIILCLIWLRASNLSIFISFLMVLPIAYANLLEGIRQTDGKMLEMARLFRLSPWRRICFIYLPQIKPYLLSAASVSLGLAWKAGIAAEVIGIPNGSIGEQLYNAKVYLDTPDLFAWTIVIIVVSIVFEKLCLRLLRAAYAQLERI
jgi:NitT/TauT family transport system permease protein